MTVPPDGQPDATSVLLPGPWTHRDISANGIRLHAAEAGEGPLVLLLHGGTEHSRSAVDGRSASWRRAAGEPSRGWGADRAPARPAE